MRRGAILHDFCMCIPYGATLAVIGLSVTVMGMAKYGLLVLSIGGVEMILSTISLKAWKKRAGNGKWTLCSSLFSLLLTYLSAGLWKLGAYRPVTDIVGGLSALMTLFLWYNLLAGGNPAPKSE